MSAARAQVVWADADPEEADEEEDGEQVGIEDPVSTGGFEQSDESQEDPVFAAMDGIQTKMDSASRGGGEARPTKP